MTNQEAIEKFEKSIASNTEAFGRSAESDEVIVAFRLAVDALKKQIPMKPKLNYQPGKISRFFGERDLYTCRYCGNALLTRMANERNEIITAGIAGKSWTGQEVRDRMSKAIFVMDRMPKHCAECPVVCDETPSPLERPKGCPLKELPEYKTSDEESPDAADVAYEVGWNECLKEIGGDGDADSRRDGGKDPE